MHYDDLELCRYQHGGPFDAGNWSVPLSAVGWLEHPHAYGKGTSPGAFLVKLRDLVSSARAYPQCCFCGVHKCSLCAVSWRASPGPIWSQENIFVPGAGCVYVAPGGVVHYVESHKYLPPPEFVESFMPCPAYGSQEFQQALRSANRNQPI